MADVGGGDALDVDESACEETAVTQAMEDGRGGHKPADVGRRDGEESKAQGVGEAAKGEGPFVAEAGEQETEDGEEEDFRELADREDRADVCNGKAQRLDERPRADEVNLMNHGDRERDERYDKKAGMFEEGEGFGEREGIFAGLDGWSSWQGKGSPYAVDDGEHARDAQTIGPKRGGVGFIYSADERRQFCQMQIRLQPKKWKCIRRDDPANGPPHANGGELFFGIVQMGEGNRIGQRQRRHVEDGIKNRERDEGVIVVDRGGDEFDNPAADQKQSQVFFGVDEAIGDLAGEEWGRDCADGGGQSKNPADLSAGEAESAFAGFPHQIVRQIRKPDAPDGVLEEHHQGQGKCMSLRCAHAGGDHNQRMPFYARESLADVGWFYRREINVVISLAAGRSIPAISPLREQAMKISKLYLPLLSVVFLWALVGSVKAQDNVTGGNEPIVNSIDPSKLTYDYLVDGNLAQDDPASKKYKTLQAAYAAAGAGTEQKPTVIGIKPNVYQLPGGARTPSMSITKNWITFLGLTNNRRSVVLADNRGHMEGADDDGYILDVNATGFAARNLTILNYTNVDYEYPGDPAKNLKMRNATITQAVALQAAGDRHVYENVALCSRLDTMFLRTSRSYFKNVFIEGTDDFIGGGEISYWEDCRVIFPTGSGVMSAGGVVFKNTTFESTAGMQFSKGPGRPDALIDCLLPVNSAQNPVAWIRGKAPPRPTQYYLTYRCKDAAGNPAVIRDGSVNNSGTAFGRELSNQEVLAFNPWNLLRGRDGWDPTGTTDRYVQEKSQVYRMTLNPASSTIRTNAKGATINATVLPAIAANETISWSTNSKLISLDRTSGPTVNVTGNNGTLAPEWVSVTATASNGFHVNAYIYVEPAYTDPPAITAGPKLNAPSAGSIGIDYTLDLSGHEDQSLISWYICDDASGAGAREIAVSRGGTPLKELPLTLGYVGKFIKATIAPKHQVSDAGPAKSVVAQSPIIASDVNTTTVDPDFRNFVEAPNLAYVSGLWTVNGTWTIQAGDQYENGFGIRVASRGASLLYQQDAACGDMQIDLVMTPEKTEGMVFGSPGTPVDGDENQKMDIYIKYDARTRNGYTLRIWRTTESASKCKYQFFKIVDGAGSPASDQQDFTGVFKPNTHMTVKVIGSKITVAAHNDQDQETLSLEANIAPNHFGGGGVYFSGSVPRGNSVIYSQMKILYLGG